MANSQEKDKTYATLRQGDTAEREKNRIITIITQDKQRRDSETTFFRNTTLSVYTEASLAQFIGHRPKPEWKKDYQYNIFDPITRDKVMAILSKSAGLYEAQFFSTNKKLSTVSQTIATVLGAFYSDSNRRLNEKDKNKMTMLQALIAPKSILYEGWKYQRRTIQDIVERNEYGDVIKTTPRKVVHYNGPWSELCHVEEIIPGSLRIRELQEQPRFTWIPKMQMEQFRRMFPKERYPEAVKVQSAGKLFENDLSEFTIRNDLKESEVEVVYFFEKWDDRLSIVANGVLLTPPKTNPMPFAHKDYPFVWGGFEELSPFFIYDMPLPMKILDMQDMNNEILSLTLDMVWRALNDVILVGSGDDINDDELYGGGLVGVTDPKNFQKLEFGSSFAVQSATAMMERAKRSIESSSLDAPVSGQSGTRQITAREVMIAREAALEITTLFLQNMEAMERDKAFLRVKNQLDRYKRPIDWKKNAGATDEEIAVFREISVRDAKLDDGRRGKVNINITETPRPKEELDKINIENDKELSQTIDISPEVIREIDFDVEIVANSSVKKSKGVEVAEARAFLTDANAMPDVLNREYAAEEYVKKLGKKPDEALVKGRNMPSPLMPKEGEGQPKIPGVGETPIPQDSVEAVLNAQL